MKIYHHTHKAAFEAIQSVGYLDLEGCNAKKGWDQMSRQQRRMVYKLIGRHLWFTTSPVCRTASSNEITLTFDSDKIGAVKWSDYKRRFKNSKAKWAMVEAFDDSAKFMGDDSDDYWLVSNKVSLEAQE